MDDFNVINRKLGNWYETNKRDLPWRNTSDPYIIWVSEIVLQQTRVAQGTAYFNRIIARFPTVASLAQAHEDELMKLWQGLGYYSRARNMQAAAKQVQTEFAGKFPTTYNHLLKLKGIGPYTAAAIASICANEPVAVVDGNVERVISRLFTIEDAVNETKGKKSIVHIAQQMLDVDNPGNHNQAIMELGALICSPKAPDCNTCPLQNNCGACLQQKQLLYPIKTKKVKQRVRYFNYFYLQLGNAVFMQKRQKGDIWEGLYQLVLIETSHLQEPIKAVELLADCYKLNKKCFLWKSTSPVIKHVLSHQIIQAVFYGIVLNGAETDVSVFNMHDYILVSLSEIEKYPVARLTERFFETLE